MLLHCTCKLDTLHIYIVRLRTRVLIYGLYLQLQWRDDGSLQLGSSLPSVTHYSGRMWQRGSVGGGPLLYDSWLHLNEALQEKW